MNILLVTETYLPFISGVSSSSDSIARFMAGKGHNVTVLCPRPVLPGRMTPMKGIAFVTTPSVRDPVYKGKPMTVFPFGFPGIYRTLTSRRFDVVHIQEPGSLGLSALIAAGIVGVPTVGALHFTPDQVARMVTGGKSNTFIRKIAEYYIRAVYHKYTAIMVPTQTFVDYLSVLGIRSRVRVVSNGVNTDEYTPPKTPRRSTKSQMQVLYIGRLDKDKNVMTLIEALPHADPSVTLIIAGSGKDKQILLDRAKVLQVEHRILWKGTITEEQMIALYREVDCFVIMAEFEIQSIVTLQALASGLPVLGARAGALPELIHDGENGYTLEPHDAKGLGQKMTYLLTHPEERVRMGEKSRAISLAHHKPTALALLEGLYTEAITAYTRHK